MPAGKKNIKKDSQWETLALDKKISSSNEETTGSLLLGKLFNRDLSWLHFNDRVLSEASDPAVPALERLRFAAIVSSNLDEFFMTRVSEIMKLARTSPSSRFPDGLTARNVLGQIRERTLRQKTRQAEIFKQIVESLAENGIKIFTAFETDRSLDAEIRAGLPEIQYRLLRLSDHVPELSSSGIYVFVRFAREYAILRIKNREERLLHLRAKNNQERFVLLERWLSARAKELFPGKEVVESFPFKLIRDADLRYRPDDEETLEEQIIEAVERRSSAKIVRLEVDSPTYSEGAIFLSSLLGIDSAALYRFDLPLDLRTLAKITALPNKAHLCYPPIEPVELVDYKNRQDIFSLIKKQDILLHHPYDSFETVLKFLEQAAQDPQVTQISHALYRTNRFSRVMEALKLASKNGKRVTTYIEIKARFDELNNVRWAEELRKHGVRVIRPMGGFKVHSKMTQIFRDEGGASVSYLHLGTGNYHEGTARQYTDLGLLTTDQTIGEECARYYEMIAKRKDAGEFKELLVAPKNLYSEILHLIHQETELQKGGKRGHIVAKLNALADPDIINALYAASSAGVKIELIVRGTCCIRPGIPNLSENIRVVSIVDRFLEHSRIYYFRSGGEHKIYLSSADWRPRNFYRRYEIAFPIKDPVLRKYLWEVILATGLKDNVKSWVLKRDGTYARTEIISDKVPRIRSQFLFENLAKRGYRETILAHRLPASAAAPLKD